MSFIRARVSRNIILLLDLDKSKRSITNPNQRGSAPTSNPLPTPLNLPATKRTEKYTTKTLVLASTSSPLSKLQYRQPTQVSKKRKLDNQPSASLLNYFKEDFDDITTVCVTCHFIFDLMILF